MPGGGGFSGQFVLSVWSFLPEQDLGCHNMAEKKNAEIEDKHQHNSIQNKSYY